MPLTFGGRIRTIEEVDIRIRNGADKIVLNTGAFENNSLITESAQKYGSQAVVISIDYKIIDQHPIVFTHFGEKNTSLKVEEWIRKVEDLGAGEIFVNAIDRDGKANGYDIANIGKFVNLTKLPLVACGGAGDMYDFVDLAQETNVSGIAAGNVFHFTERSYPRAKQLMKKNGIDVR
jgi:cyclase